MKLDLDRSQWKRVKFGDIVRNVNEYFDREGGGTLPYVAGPHIEPGELRPRYGSTDDDVFPPTFKRMFVAGDVLVHSRGIEKVAVPDRRGVTGEKLFVLRSLDAEMLDQRFLPFLVTSPLTRKHMADNFTGSVNKFLNWKPLAALEFDLPPLDQQGQIADLFWSIENELRALATLSRSVNDSREELRNSRFEDEPLVSAFEDVCTVASQNGVSKAKESRQGTYPMVNMGELFRDEVLHDSDFERVGLDDREQAKMLLFPGDLLFARRSIVFEGAGLCCLVPPMAEQHTFESSVIRATPDSSIVSSKFLLHFFRSAAGRRQMSSIVRRGPVSGIAGSDLRKLLVPVPPMARQLECVSLIEKFDSVITSSNLSQVDARKLRTTLLQEIWVSHE